MNEALEYSRNEIFERIQRLQRVKKAGYGSSRGILVGA